MGTSWEAREWAGQGGGWEVGMASEGGRRK